MLIMGSYCTATNLSIFIFTAFVRKIQDLFDETWGVFSMIPINFLSLTLVLSAKPEYKRTNVDRCPRMNDVRNGETKNLITN